MPAIPPIIALTLGKYLELHGEAVVALGEHMQLLERLRRWSESSVALGEFFKGLF